MHNSLHSQRNCIHWAEAAAHLPGHIAPTGRYVRPWQHHTADACAPHAPSKIDSIGAAVSARERHCCEQQDARHVISGRAEKGRLNSSRHIIADAPAGLVLLRMRVISGVSSMASFSNPTSNVYGTLYADCTSALLSAGVGINSTVPSPTCHAKHDISVHSRIGR